MEDFQSLKKKFMTKLLGFILLHLHSLDWSIRQGILYYNWMRSTGNVPIELSELTGDLTPMGLLDVVKAAATFLYEQFIYYFNFNIS